ncbi:MAG: hypothetical protein AAGB93_12575 [Planctomycetota bacterium]
MQRLSSALPAAVLAACAIATPALGFDRIYRSDGSILDNVKVQSETIDKVVYQPEKGRAAKEVLSEEVLRVEFTQMPDDIAAAEVDAKNDALLGAISGFQNFLGNADDRANRKFPWAASYARFRLVEMQERRNAIPEMVAAVDELLVGSPDSRYVPIAIIKKFEAQLLSNDRAGAAATADQFGALVTEKGMSQRWKYEHQVRELLAKEGQTASAAEKALQKIASDASAYPTVANRADVATAESMLGRSAFDEAEEMFRGVTESTNADDRTLAAAWTGLGDCLYRRAELKGTSGDAEGATALFSEARTAFMRVVVLYEGELAFVAKSAFYAGRCIQEIGGENAEDESNRLFTFVAVNFRGSRWADSARQFKRRNG